MQKKKKKSFCKYCSLGFVVLTTTFALLKLGWHGFLFLLFRLFEFFVASIIVVDEHIYIRELDRCF